MDEAERQPPHAGKRLTRGDVLRLIEEHGGPEGLDLRGADLSQADLSEPYLRGEDLSWANLQEADLWSTKLQGALLMRADLRQARLIEANLGGVYLTNADMSDASLSAADLHGAYFMGAKLRRASLALANLRDANLEGADWGDYVLGEEIAGDFDQAASAYRALKQRHTDSGMYDIAGEFHYREMEARRKLAWRGEILYDQPRRRRYAVTLYALRFLYGYGERPERVVLSAAAVILGFALGHWLSGTVAGGFLEALYYSAVSFPALGYGSWAPVPQGWAGKFLGAGESLLGVFMMALFLVTFTRKMTR